MKAIKSTLFVALLILVFIGATIIVQNKNLFTDGIFDLRSPREKQLAYLKEHKKEIEDFVKSLNPKSGVCSNCLGRNTLGRNRKWNTAG